ncbi:MAG: flagellar basal body rod protein FlgB [Gemmataceae bacterium]
MISGDGQIALLTRVLDVATLRHRVIAENVANVNTPGYQRQAVAFSDAFARALSEGKWDAALQAPARVVAGAGDPRADGNNVDMDVEMGELQQNSMLFQVYAQILALRIAQMRSAISGH